MPQQARKWEDYGTRVQLIVSLLLLQIGTAKCRYELLLEVASIESDLSVSVSHILYLYYFHSLQLVACSATVGRSLRRWLASSMHKPCLRLITDQNGKSTPVSHSLDGPHQRDDQRVDNTTISSAESSALRVGTPSSISHAYFPCSNGILKTKLEVMNSPFSPFPLLNSYMDYTFSYVIIRLYWQHSLYRIQNAPLCSYHHPSVSKLSRDT